MTWPWTALLAWGGGWATASVLLPVSAYLVDPSSPAAVFAAALVVGTPLLGAPIYVTARGTGARYPGVEATLWVVLLATIVVIFVRATMSFEPINAVTTADIRRGQHGGTWPYPPELVWGIRGAVAFCTLAGLSSTLLNGGTRHLFGLLWRAVLFSAGVAIALGAAALLFALAGPLVWRLFPVYTPGGSDVWRLIPVEMLGVAMAAFLPGCLAGAAILAVRRVLMDTSQAPASLGS